MGALIICFGQIICSSTPVDIETPGSMYAAATFGTFWPTRQTVFVIGGLLWQDFEIKIGVPGKLLLHQLQVKQRGKNWDWQRETLS